MLHHKNEKRKRSVQLKDPVSELPEKISKDDESVEEIIEDDLEAPLEQEDSGGDEDYDFSEGESLLEYFTAKNPCNDWQKWLIGFYNYLHYPDCGRKNNRNRL